MGMQVLRSGMPNLPMQAQETLEVWYELLKDLSFEQIKKGVLKFCKDHLEVYPNTNVAAYIRKYALEEEAKGVPTAKEAWEAVERERERVLRERTPPKIDDPRARYAADAVGWKDLLGGNRQDARERFIEYYNNQVERDNAYDIVRSRGEY